MTRGKDTVSLFLHPQDVRLPSPGLSAHLIYTLLLDVFKLMKFPPCPGSPQKKVKEEKQPDVKGCRGLGGGRGGEMESDVK